MPGGGTGGPVLAPHLVAAGGAWRAAPQQGAGNAGSYMHLGTPAHVIGGPAHTYIAKGAYTVTLAVSGPGGTDTETKTGYITVRSEYNVYLPLVAVQLALHLFKFEPL